MGNTTGLLGALVSGSQRCLESVSWGAFSDILYCDEVLEQEDAAGRRVMSARIKCLEFGRLQATNYVNSQV